MNKSAILLAVLSGGLLLNIACNQEASHEAVNKPVPDRTETIAQDTMPTTVSPEATADSTYLLGVWYDEGIKAPDGANIAYQVIISNEQRVFIQPVTFKGEKFQVSDMPVVSPGAAELKKSGNRYLTVESPEDSYEVNKDGDLLIYHNNELLATCKKLL